MSKKEEKKEEKSGPRMVPSKGVDGRADTKVADAKDLVATYAKRRGWTVQEAHDYLIYVGYNRRAALERYEPAAPKAKKKTATKKAA